MTVGTGSELAPYAQWLAEAPVLPHTPAVIDVNTTQPWNPSAQVQQKFVGASFDGAYADAARFVGQAFSWAAELGGTPPSASDRILDFGSGWGRITRILLSRYRPTQLYCLDVDPEMTALVQSTLPGVNAFTGAAYPPSALGNATMTEAFAFSVFSHLAQDAHVQWAEEFARLIKPGGLAFITVLDEMFLDQVQNCHDAVATETASPFAEGLAAMIPDVPRVREEFARGSFIYGDPGADGVRTGDFYGWAIAPRTWMEANWGQHGFEVVRWVPSGVLFEQAMVCLRRK